MSNIDKFDQIPKETTANKPEETTRTTKQVGKQAMSAVDGGAAETQRREPIEIYAREDAIKHEPELGAAIFSIAGVKGNKEDAGVITGDGKRMAVIDGMGGGRKAAEFADTTCLFARRFLSFPGKKRKEELAKVCNKVCQNLHRIDQNKEAKDRFDRDRDGAVLALVDAEGDSIDVAIVGDAEVIIVDSTDNKVVLRTQVQNAKEYIINMACNGDLEGLFEMALDGDFMDNPYGFKDRTIVKKLALNFFKAAKEGAPIDEKNIIAFREAYGKAVITNSIDSTGTLDQQPFTYQYPKQAGHKYRVFAMSDGAGEFLENRDFLNGGENLAVHLRKLHRKIQAEQKRTGHYDHATIGVITG